MATLRKEAGVEILDPDLNAVEQRNPVRGRHQRAGGARWKVTEC